MPPPVYAAFDRQGGCYQSMPWVTGAELGTCDRFGGIGGAGDARDIQPHMLWEALMVSLCHLNFDRLTRHWFDPCMS